MIARRAFASAMLALPIALAAERAFARKRGREVIDALAYPPVHDHGSFDIVRRRATTARQRERADTIVKAIPFGPRPIDIAQSFVDRFYHSEPETISQAAPPAALNPLISRFFETTTSREDGDVIAWCAAFVNFCIDRNGGAGSRSASSQSFLQGTFRKTETPVEGDLAVFTCFDAAGRSLNLGHVAFFRERMNDGHIHLVGGNQAANGYSSIISETVVPTTDRSVRRHLANGNYTALTMRLNAFVSLNG